MRIDCGRRLKCEFAAGVGGRRPKRELTKMVDSSAEMRVGGQSSSKRESKAWRPNDTRDGRNEDSRRTPDSQRALPGPAAGRWKQPERGRRPAPLSRRPSPPRIAVTALGLGGPAHRPGRGPAPERAPQGRRLGSRGRGRGAADRATRAVRAIRVIRVI